MNETVQLTEPVRAGVVFGPAIGFGRITLDAAKTGTKKLVPPKRKTVKAEAEAMTEEERETEELLIDQIDAEGDLEAAEDPAAQKFREDRAVVETQLVVARREANEEKAAREAADQIADRIAASIGIAKKD